MHVRVEGERPVLVLSGTIDGSTACQVARQCVRSLPAARELIVDLRAVRRAEPFGLEVLERRLSRAGRGPRITFRASPELLRALGAMGQETGPV